MYYVVISLRIKRVQVLQYLYSWLLSPIPVDEQTVGKFLVQVEYDGVFVFTEIRDLRQGVWILRGDHEAIDAILPIKNDQIHYFLHELKPSILRLPPYTGQKNVTQKILQATNLGFTVQFESNSLLVTRICQSKLFVTNCNETRNKIERGVKNYEIFSYSRYANACLARLQSGQYFSEVYCGASLDIGTNKEGNALVKVSFTPVSKSLLQRKIQCLIPSNDNGHLNSESIGIESLRSIDILVKHMTLQENGDITDHWHHP